GGGCQSVGAPRRPPRPPGAAAARAAPPPAATRPKITDRIEPGSPQAPATQAPSTQAAVPAAQKVVLYEEDPADPNGKRFVGSAIWRTETVTPGPGQPPELAIRADVEVPERRLAMTWSLRRNTDKGLPATHTVEIMFKVPPDFPSGGISNVPGILMKQAEQTRGTPLAGLAVKVTPGFYLIGLSNAETDKDRNLQLLKERSWFDIPVVYNNNRRAILALEKGTPGERVFADPLKAWKQYAPPPASRAYAARPYGRVDVFLPVGRRRIDRRGAEERDELAPPHIEDRSAAVSIAGVARLRVRSHPIRPRCGNKTCAHRGFRLAARSIGPIRCRRTLQFGLARMSSSRRRARACRSSRHWPRIAVSSISWLLLRRLSVRPRQSLQRSAGCRADRPDQSRSRAIPVGRDLPCRSDRRRFPDHPKCTA